LIAFDLDTVELLAVCRSLFEAEQLIYVDEAERLVPLTVNGGSELANGPTVFERV